jgi:hypothetical protein
MKKIPFILFSLVLGAVILVGCGEWLAKRKAERDDAKKQAEAAKQDSDKANAVSKDWKPCNDTLWWNDFVRGHKMKKIPPLDKNEAETFYIDTSKRGLLPNFTIDNLFNCYAYLFPPLPDGYKMSIRKYESVFEKGAHLDISFRGLALASLGRVIEKDSFITTITYDYPRYYSTDTIALLGEKGALDIVTSIDYTYKLHREIMWEIEMKAKLGYIPEERPFVRRYKFGGAGPHFVWQDPTWLANYRKELGDPQATYRPKGQLIWYPVDNSDSLALCYKFIISTLDEDFEVVISARTGIIMQKKPLTVNAGTCNFANTNDNSDEATVTATLIPTYNGINAALKNIQVDACNFANTPSTTNCNKFHLKKRNTTADIEAYYAHTDSESDNVQIEQIWANNGDIIPPALSVSVNANNVITGIDINSLSNETMTLNGASYTPNTAPPSMSPGIYPLVVSTGTSTDCAYNYFVGVGTNPAPTMSINNTNPQTKLNPPCISGSTVSMGGDAFINVGKHYPSGSALLVIWQGGDLPGNTSYQPISGNSFLASDIMNLQPGQVPAGNYVFLLRETSMGSDPTLYKALYVRIEQTNCPELLSKATTAYWAVSRAHNFFRQSNTINTTSTTTATVDVRSIISGSTILGMDPNYYPFSDATTAIKPANYPIKVAISPNSDDSGTRYFGTGASPPIRIRLGGGTTSTNDHTRIDIAAHEFGHAVNLLNLNIFLDNGMADESCTIVEGFCDIVGVLVEAGIQPIDYTIGENSFKPGVIRDFANPKQHCKPSTYKGANWDDAPTAMLPYLSDCAPYSDTYRYQNSTVLTHWFYLLANGGSNTIDQIPTGVPYDLGSGIGINAASKIVIAAFTNSDYLLISPTDIGRKTSFSKMANATLKAAIELFPPIGGECSPQVIAVVESWKAVGIHCLSVAGICNACIADASPETATCDKRKPYIKRLIARQNLTTRYDRAWEMNADCNKICLIPNPAITLEHIKLMNGATPQPFEIEVHGSEPFGTLTFEGIAESAGAAMLMYNASDYFTTTVSNNIEQTIWTFTVTQLPGVVIPNAIQYDFMFAGTDLAGNSLLKVKDMATSITTNGVTRLCISLNDKLPIKTPSGQWQPIPLNGVDRMHKFFSECPTSPENTTCDNTLPYLKSMTMSQYDADDDQYYLIASQAWQEATPNLCFEPYVGDLEPYNSFLDVEMNQNIKIIVEASEPLTTLNLERITLGTISYEIDAGNPLSLISIESDANAAIWTILLERTGDFISSDFVDNSSNDYHLHFTGTDMAGNPLQVLQNMPNYNAETFCVPISDLPVRTADGTWSARHDGTDQTFSIAIDYCGYNDLNIADDAVIGGSPYGSIMVTPTTGADIASYSIYNNETNALVQSHILDTQSGGVLNSPGFATFGNTLPDSYTLVVTFVGGCQKAISLTNAEPCNNSLDMTVTAITPDELPGYSQVTFQFDISQLVEPIAFSISEGSLGVGLVEGLTNETGYTFLFLNDELNNLFAYNFIANNGNIYCGKIRPFLGYSYPVDPGTFVSDSGAPRILVSTEDLGSTCMRSSVCIDYTIDSGEPAVPISCNLPDAQITLLSDVLQADSTYRQTGKLCWTPDEALSSYTQTITLIAQAPSGMTDTTHCTLQVVANNLQVATNVQHARSVCGEDNCGGAIVAEISGGSGSYDIVWGDNITQNTRTNLCGGVYNVTVTDTQTGCTAANTANVGIIVEQGGNEVVTYTALLDEPEIRLSPTLFDNSTRVNYDLPEDGFVTIKVYNLQGVLIETLVDEEYREAGSYELNNEAGEFNNGLYLFSLEVCDRNKTQIGIKY